MPLSATGTRGWDQYAPYYDWENARTLGRRDLPFWRDVARRERKRGPLLEFGCGTGRLLIPLARAGIGATGVDLSSPMLGYAIARARKLPRARRPRIARADIRRLPFRARTFGMVLAPYGMLQSLIDDRDLDSALAEAARVLRPGALLGIDLVPDLATWSEYHREVRMRGRSAQGGAVTLIESVRQDRRRGLTIFDEDFTERRGRKKTRARFSLTFRTRPMHEIIDRLERAGFTIDTIVGSYKGGAWDPLANVWVILARRTGHGR